MFVETLYLYPDLHVQLGYIPSWSLSVGPFKALLGQDIHLLSVGMYRAFSLLQIQSGYVPVEPLGHAGLDKTSATHFLSSLVVEPVIDLHVVITDLHAFIAIVIVDGFDAL